MIRRIIFGLLCCLSFGIMAFGFTMLKIAYDLTEPGEFLALFFAGSLVILIGGAFAIGSGIRVVQKNEKKLKYPLKL